jgi:hypothetical protein
MAGGWILILTFCFIETTQELLQIGQTEFGTAKDRERASFIWIIIFFDRHFEYGGNFKLLGWMQNLHQLTWGHKILYADIFKG